LQGVASAWSTATFNAAEQLEQDEIGFDLITSVLGLHLTNDLPGALVQIRQLLSPDGVFAAALFGGLTLQELRNALTSAESAVSGGASPRVAPFADVREVGNLLQRTGFALPVADAERTTVLYRSFDRLIGDLRTNAQTSALVSRSRHPISRRARDEAIAHYQRHFAEPDGRLRATFEVIYVIAFAPAENQPKPLRPGSATHRLAEALGAQETPLPKSPTLATEARRMARSN
jgi:SAM-dependent methyltransferase